MMKLNFIKGMVLILGFVFVGCSQQAMPSSKGTTVMTASSSLGTILVDSNGMTLYEFKKDTPGVSNCEGACASLWPPLTVTVTPTETSDIPGMLATITRSDGSKQVTYEGMPLYTFASDKAPGDTSGQGYNNLWYVVNISS
jgi:predicted lipoprotein with Yx(FWY)xxD motif